MNPVKPAKSKQSNNCQCVLTELIGRGSFFFSSGPFQQACCALETVSGAFWMLQQQNHYIIGGLL